MHPLHLTTHRKPAEPALAGLGRYFPDLPAGKTTSETLPEGRPGKGERAGIYHRLRESCPWLSEKTARRFASLCCHRIDLIGQSASFADLTLCEVSFLCDTKWEVTAEDILWRRTKPGLQFGDAGAEDLADRLREIMHVEERQHASA